MDDRRLSMSGWVFSLAYVALVLLMMLAQILPLSTEPASLPGPDLILCVTCAFVMRRPHLLPAPLIAAMLLIGDMVFMRPPGLWTALVLVATEFLRAREPSSRDQPFAVEWLLVTAAMLGAMVGYRLLLALFLVERAALAPVAVQALATVLAYPLVVVVCRYLFGLRRMSAGELDERGRRI